MANDTYVSPLSGRYASCEMQRIFSPDYKFSAWRRLWVALAESEMELGLPIAPHQVAQMKEHLTDIDYAAARRYEEKVRHDVMAHVLTYGDACPDARPIIHLGATSCYVTDNADILMLRDAMALVRAKAIEVIRRLRPFAAQYRDLPTLGYTHLQPAQPVTVGKRACLWLQDLLMDIAELDDAAAAVKLLGNKGTTGTQASFVELFEGDGAKADALEQMIAQKLGMDAVFPVSGQTYPRKLDHRLLSSLSSLAQSAYKFAQDLRLLQSMREIEEPFEKDQIGSSAMAYKRNPMRSERICALARHVMALTQNAAMTASVQWFERTLDDSANRRLSLPEAFLAADGMLELYANVADGLVVYPKMIERNLREQLPFMATENILMAAVKAGGDRQELHERIRVHSQAAAARVKGEGLPNDLTLRIAGDPAFGLSAEHLDQLLDARRYVGRAPEQVDRFLIEHVDPVLAGASPLDIGRIAI
ncbi:MAG: adenylosuccinate lyase [Clostridiales bacterium]|nr:adenylosuccinate lyase [Clostridiales bacterium]